jgi:Leucine-rich repeat (LRR) protein
VISTCPVEDIGLLAGKPLQVVRLGSSQTPLISDLSPLKDAPLKSFTLYGSRVKDLSPLAGKELNTLSLSGSPISDLKPVAGMPLMTVQLSSLEVTNLAPLKGSALQRVELQNLQVKELKPLAGCPLTYLQIKNMPKLVDAQSIPDYFPDLTDLLLHESQAKPEMIGRLAALKKLTLYTAASPDGVVVPVSSFKKP